MTDQLNTSTSTQEQTAPPSGAQTTQAKGAEGTGEGQQTTTAPRTYSEEEWNKRQSAYDKQLNKATQRVKELEDERAKVEETSRNSELERWFAGIQDAGGDPTNAKKMVEAIQADWRKAKEILARERELNEKAAILTEAGRGKAAQDLVVKHGLEAGDVDKLLEAPDSKEMEMKALELALAKAKTSATPTDRTDSGGNRGVQRDFSKMPGSVALGTLWDEFSKSKK